MSHDPQRADCPNCNTPDVELEPVWGGESLGNCPNCESSFTEFDREYRVVDVGDDSEDANRARESNRDRGFIW